MRASKGMCRWQRIRGGGLAGFGLCLTIAFVFASAGCQRPCEVAQGHGGARARVERYGMLRAGTLLVRLDSATGKVWIVAASGDGGWVQVGDPPPDGGERSEPGRYAVQSIPAAKTGFGQRGRPRLLRSDRYTGQAWIAEASRGQVWKPLVDPESPEG